MAPMVPPRWKKSSSELRKSEQISSRGMKVIAVLDSSIGISGIGWRGEARNVLRLLARRAFVSIRTPYLTREWTETLAGLSAEPRWPNPNWAGWLEWFKTKSRLVDDPPLKRIVRDPKDDPILAGAISQRADYRFPTIRIFWILKRLACVALRHAPSSRKFCRNYNPRLFTL